MTLRYPQVLLLLCTLTALSPAMAADSVKLDTPVGGWRSGAPEGEGESFRQTVNYPASSVNTPVGQANTARISGEIKATRKDNEPGRLIVNGVSMPLKIDDSGHFDRPFSFPNGSNSVEVRSPDGQQRHRTQFLNTSGGATPAKLRVLLAWDSDGTDLDLHLVTPDGAHIWYGNRSAANGAALDVDVTTGYGPEIFAMPAPIKGQYLVYVNYYGGGYRGDDEGGDEAVQALTTAQVTVITGEGTPSEKMETFLIPMRAVGELTLVKSFSYP
ncbi:signal peptide protein [Pseudomonas chlororaphis]|uniref:Signal peptide protein n=1 Tax=Pseudomonas chlororaphis TaxID=587753 RepID=A0A0A6DDQ8_9PSED|nr:signal peptide protein [Pseudomonas chlororaphis]